MLKLELPTLNTDRIIGVYAKSRYGKTNLIANILQEICKKWFVIFYDINYEEPKFRGVNFNKHLIFVSPSVKSADSLASLNNFIKRSRASSTNFFIYVEDLDAFFERGSSISLEASELKDLVGRGGHQRVGFIYAAKQPRFIPLKVVSLTNLIYIGKFQQEDDVSALRNYASANQISSLQNREFIEYDDWSGQRAKIVAPQVLIKQ